MSTAEIGRFDGDWDLLVKVSIPGLTDSATGTLEFRSGASITLKIVDAPPEGVGIVQGLPNIVYPEISGMDNHGRAVTMYDCFMSSSSSSIAGGFTRKEFVVNAVIIGIPPNKFDEIVYKRIVFSLSGIEEWIGHGAFRPTIPVHNESSIDSSLKAWAIEVRGESYPIRELPIEDGAVGISGSMSFRDRDLDTIRLVSKVSNWVRLENPACAERLVSRAMGLQTIFSLAARRYLAPSSMTLFRDLEGTSGERGSTFVALYASASSEPESATDFSIPFVEVVDRMGDLLDQYTRLGEPASTLAGVLLSGRHGKILSDYGFLVTIAAIEGFHRSQFPGQYVGEKEFDNISSALNESIPKGIPAPLRERLKSAIKFSNEPSLRSRLGTMFREELGESVVSRIVGDPGKYIHSVVSTRNDLAHQLPEKSGIPHGEKMHYAYESVKYISRIYLLNKIGIPIDVIDSILEKSRQITLIRNKLESIY